ncbi:hypothetical protein D3874_02880 [Oleomonas cavernae]|uniref:Uncharacterized protein n=1 Tax=Oleomonas cavernae TaxID=2320859 RepID=A0A418WUB7_9PROT|nr:hypothetical protein [Oleomonas cavernae]RJF94776.1 hypothetical protein D3874_02880 [Oleomonas cavernae]
MTNLLLGSAVLVSASAAAGLGLGQDAEPVSASAGQDGGPVAVAGTSFVLEGFGGGDDNGAIYGGAGSIAIPLGDRGGLQADAIAGVAGGDTGFGGGALQLFYRDPQRFSVGIAGGGYALDSVSQYAVAGFAEFYLDTITLEGMVGYQGGDIADSWYGRAGLSVYATPNLRLGAGVRYDEVSEWAGDVQVEALLGNSPGLSLYATGVFDDDGALGVAGVRFYFNAGDDLLATDRTKQASDGPTLFERHRYGTRPNFITSDPGFGLRQIAQAAGALNGDNDGFGSLSPGEGDAAGASSAASSSTASGSTASALGGSGVAGEGLIDSVDTLLGDLGSQTALEPVTGLVQSLVDPAGGVLAPLTSQLNAATAIDSGPLGPLTSALAAPLETLGEALNPVVATLGDGLGTASGGFLAVGGPLTGVPLVGDLLGAVTGSFLAGGADAKTETTLSLVGGLLGGSIENATGGPLLGELAPLADAIGPMGPFADVPMIGGLLRGVLGGLVE